MPNPGTTDSSEYNQSSFLGGMNLLGDDSRLMPNQYRAGFNLTNRYDVLDPTLKSVRDVAAPVGVKQECLTFGNFIVLFVAGLAYYRHYLSEGWIQIVGFKMSSVAPRYWTTQIPISTTNYVRIAATGETNTGTSNPEGAIQLSSVQAAGQGNLPGLLVQDNVNQPQFIFLSNLGIPICRVTQSFIQWSITFTDATNTIVAKDSNSGPLDNREYVPIGSSMCWEDGVLYITAQDGQSILRSVSGRPLDFVINVTNQLAINTAAQTWTYIDPFTKQPFPVTVPPYTMSGGGAFEDSTTFHPGGDATTTSYSVGVGGIVCLRPMSTGGIFVAASNANFLVQKNESQNAPKIFGEYTFIRRFLFNATCLSDRVIFDSIGDTRFIGLTGVRSFNAISQTQNEGRNVSFTASIRAAFGSEEFPITQNATKTAGILYNDYELYAMETIFGPTIAKYDTTSQCWTSFDLQQTAGKAIKILAKIELTVQRLFAVTEDDQVYTLYIGPGQDEASFRTISICANILYENSNIRMANPKSEIKLTWVRAILNKITSNCNCSMTPYTNNRLDQTGTMTKAITYENPAIPSDSSDDLPDVNTLLMNLFWSTSNAKQGWKVFFIFSWTGGSFTQFSLNCQDTTPTNPPNSQELTT